MEPAERKVIKPGDIVTKEDFFDERNQVEEVIINGSKVYRITRDGCRLLSLEDPRTMREVRENIPAT